MGLFESLFNSIFGEKKDIKETQLEKELNQNGIEYLSKKIVNELSTKIDTKVLATQFILEELDAARLGDEFAQNFAKYSGFKPEEYINAMRKTKWQGEESKLEHLQLTFRHFLVQINNLDLRVLLSTSVVDEIMKNWKLGKYNTCDDSNIIEYLINNKLYISEEIFTQLFTYVNEIKFLNDDITYNGKIEKLEDSFKITKQATLIAINVKEFLTKNNFDAALDEIVAAFYIVNLSNLRIQQNLEFDKNEVRNVILTIYITATMDFNAKISDVSIESVNKTISIAKWIKSYKFNQ